MIVDSTPNAKRVLLLMSPSTYRAAAFVGAATSLGIESIAVVDMPDELREQWRQTHAVPFSVPNAAARVTDLARDARVDAVLSVDDSATELAALVGRELGLAHNAPEAATAARDKLRMREMLFAGGIRCPRFEAFEATTDPDRIVEQILFPCVVKPLRLSGSRGVIRANDAREFTAAFRRLTRILIDDGNALDACQILVEEYLPGNEVALEGLLSDGELRVLALFDKPDPLVGPYFEETIYVTPSRLPAEVQSAIERETSDAARAIGLRDGPIHAELRVNDFGPWILEIAGRSIGGLCSTILTFGSGMCLEELILRHAMGMTIPSFDRDRAAVGVMMIPIPGRGILREVAGIEEAQRTRHVTGIEITAKPNYPIVPLPEGASYLGFIFARASDPGEVESSLRAAHERLTIRIDPMLTLASASAARIAG